jgi:hypothetical protein
MALKSNEDTTLSRPFHAALYEHARFAAQRAQSRLNGPLTPSNLEQFLADNLCLRYPTRIIYDRTGLEPHQVAQPFYRQSRDGIFCDLHVDPDLQKTPEINYLVVAYMAAVINYGDAATPELAELFGALLTGIDQETFYEKMCAVADSVRGGIGFRDTDG